MNLANINTININNLKQYENEMIHFENLVFQPCLNYNETGNSIATIKVSEFHLDIIKKPQTKTYKVKPFEITTKKVYQRDIFPEYKEGFPEFAGRDKLMIFLNEVDKMNLSDVESELDEDVEEEEL